jgi:hypothetical protein
MTTMDEKELKLLEEYASLLFTIDEIAGLLKKDAAALRRDIRHGKNLVAETYFRGKMETIIAVRKNIVQFAKKGSPQAEAFVKDYLEQQNNNE